MQITKNNIKERSVLAQLYANKANSVKYLPFFFQDKKELRRFFNQFGGKTLVLPDTYEEFIQSLFDDQQIDDCNRCGIDKDIYERTKDRIVETYLLLFKSLEDVIYNECKKEEK